MTRPTARPSPLAVASLAVAMLGVPAGADAQGAGGAARSWRIEPAFGVWHQKRSPNTINNVGQFASLQLSRQPGAGPRLTATVAYHQLDDANEVRSFDTNGGSRTDIYDRAIVSLTAGIDADLRRWSATAVSVGLEVGGGGSHRRFDRSVGSVSGPGIFPSTGSDWQPVFLTTPSLAVRHAVGSRMELGARGRLLLALGDIWPRAIPTFGAGVAYRF